MKSNVSALLPAGVRRTLAKLGGDLSLARRKRALTIKMMAERTGIAKATYERIERGDPSVSMGGYAMALFVLGFDRGIGELVDPSHDELGLALDAERVPKRIRPKKAVPL